MKLYESQLQKALRLSEESFKKEQALRQQAIELEKEMKQQQMKQQQMKQQQIKQQKWSEQKSYNTLVHSMKWQPIFKNLGVGSGLQNLGNSCFMNATLQCLAYTAPFAQLLCQSKHSSPCKSATFCALCEMEKILPHMLMGKQIVKPRYLFKNIPKINDLLTPGCQEDAHEFLQSLLDKIEIAYDNAQKPHKGKDPQNPIRKLFTGATKTSIRCARCKNKSVTEEPFCCISLEVDDNVGLGEALEIFTQDELMWGADKYFCTHCNRKCIAHKRLTLSKIPPVLVLHFKRFCVEFQASHHKQGTTKKLADHVEFPELLDFKLLQHLIFEEDQKEVLMDSEYELYGVLVHSGPQLGYGHYYALIKSPDGYWYRMNDMDVIRVNTKHVLREQGYMVFYKRKTDILMQSELEQIKEDENKEEMVQDSKNNDDEIKVDPDLLTKDYFANNCNEAQDLVMVDGVATKGNDMNQNGLSQLPDRSEYVQVPPIATRPELIADQKVNGNEQEAMEIFWPPKDME